MSVAVLRLRAKALLADRDAWLRRPRVVLPLAAFVLYTLAGFLLVPALVRHYAVQGIHDALGVEAAIGEVRFNPFLFTLDLRESRFSTGAGEPLAGFGRLYVDFELSSLFRRAWTFADIRLEQPELDVVREADGRLNLQRLLAALPAAEPDAGAAAADAPPPRVLVLQAEVPGARIRYSDRTREPQASTVIGPVDLSIDEIATLESHRGPYRLNAALPGGATLAWSGQGGLHPFYSEGTLRLGGFAPRAIWDFVQPSLRLAPPGGSIDASLDYTAGMSGSELALRVESLAVSLHDLLLARQDGGAPLLSLKEAELAGGSIDVAAHTMSVQQIRLREGRVAARLDRAGVADWSTLLVETPAPAADAATAGAPWRIEVVRAALEGIAAEVYDESRNAPLSFGLQARSAGFGAHVSVGEGDPRILLSDAALDLADIVLGSGAERAPLGRVGTLAVEGASVDLAAQRVQARRIALQGVETAIHREADGGIRELKLASTPDPEVPLPVSSAAAAWQLEAGEFTVDGIRASYADAMTTPAVGYTVQDARIALSNLQLAGPAPVGVDMRLPLAEGGLVTLGGTAAGDGSAADLQLGVEGLAMTPLAPLVARDTSLQLASGTLSATAAIHYRAPAGAAQQLRAEATLGVDDLLLTESATGNRFLAWRSLAASGIEFGLGPDHLQVRELRLVEPDAKIVVHQDRSTNLAQVMRDTATVEDAPPGGAAAEPFPVSVGLVRISDGAVDFADHALVLPFAARIERLQGVVRGISSSDDSRATLKLAGRVGEFGEAEIDGQLAPFDPARYTDIEVSFRNIAMDQLSPYSATFAGRKIAAGDLDLGLEYEVTRGALTGDNKVVLQDFRLGDSVDSPGALDLPLDLAIALLTDAEGRIDLAVPVSGNLGEPQFSYGHLVGQALGNLLRGVVTAPFRALGSVFGGSDGADLQSVRFASGSALLMPREQERLAKLAEALASRPQLGVDIPPGIESARDGYAVRRLQVRRAHAALLDIELEPGEDPGPVSYDGAKSQRALEQLLELREGEDAADAFSQRYAAEHAAEPERVNAALALLGRGEGDPGYYRQMYLHLVNSTPEPRAELDALAKARVQAIDAELRARGVDAARLRQGAPASIAQARPTGVLLPLALVPLGTDRRTALAVAGGVQ